MYFSEPNALRVPAPRRRGPVCLIRPWREGLSRPPGRLLAICALLLLCIFRPALALDRAQALAVVTGDNNARIAAMRDLVAAGDPAAAAFLRHLQEGRLRIAADRLFVIDGQRVLDALTGQVAPLPAGADEPLVNNRLRREIAAAIGSLALFAGERAERLDAARSLLKSPDPSRLPLVARALEREADPAVRSVLEQVRALIELSAAERGTRLRAVAALGAEGSTAARSMLAARLASGGEADAEVQSAIRAAIARIDARLAWGERLGLVFAGLSLGSVLLLAALGLAITYGLMGVINMAHGELMMVGAYATWLVQNLFRSHLPQAFDLYLLAAIPVAFLAAALAGALLERGVIRHLYGRPLETLLATWGISLILMQGARSLFGAQNVSVENPSWMSGGVQLAANLVLPWSRIAIIVFAVIVLAGVALLLARTRLGLFVRAATQNRTMARCVGVPTGRVDTLAFAIGSGLAGLAGCALSQIGNVGPDLGQSYIIDSFMVVVLGGVGQLAGAVTAALGLGVVNKFIEGLSGPVIAKIAVLLFIVAFIQKRPQGLFAMRGRSAEG
jgi:urea transport system permease protein